MNKPVGGSGVPRFGTAPTKEPVPPKQDTKKLEKANKLFAGVGDGASKDESDSSDDDKKKKKKDKKKSKDLEKEEKKEDLIS